MITYLILFILSLSLSYFINLIVNKLPQKLNKNWEKQARSYLKAKNHITSNLKNKDNHQKYLQSLQITMLIFASLILSLHTYTNNFTILMAVLFSLTVTILSFIDYAHQILPDELTIPLLWIGLLINLNTTFCDINAAILGGISGYCSLWLIANIYYLITKKIGLGNGDFKLFAATGAWLGYEKLPIILLISSILALCYGIINIIYFKKNIHSTIPFGPFIAFAASIILFSSSI